MPTHRVDIGLRGTSHYVDGEHQGSSGFPLRGRQLPEGLRLESRVGGQAGKPHKHFVRKGGVGVSVEWTSTRDGGGAHGGRNMAGPQGQARRPGRGPGLFNVSEGDETDEEDGEDAHSRAPSRRDDHGIANYRGDRGDPGGHENHNRTMREQGSVWPRERMPREGPNRPMGGLGPNTHQNIGSRAYPSMRSNHRGRSRDPWDPANRPPVPPAGMPSHGNTRPPGPFPPIGHLSVKDMEEIGRYNEARLESGLPPDPYYRSRGSHHPPSMRNNHRPEHIDFTDPRYRPPVPPNATGGSLGGNFHRTIDPNAYPPRQIDRPGSNRPRGSFHPPSMRNNHRPEHIDFTDPRYRPPVPPNAMPSRRRRF